MDDEINFFGTKNDDAELTLLKNESG